MDNQQIGANVNISEVGRVGGRSVNAVPDSATHVERVVNNAENMNSYGAEQQNIAPNNWGNQGALGQATLAMPQPGTMPPGTELGVIINENDREREELTGEKVVGTDRPKIQDRDGLSAERLGYIEKGIHERKKDLHSLKRFATDEMMAELKGRYGRIFGSEN